MKRKVGYNFQGNNIDFKKKFSAWIQCMSTCAWMLICYYTNKWHVNDDEQLAFYVDDCEATVGKSGIGEKIKARFKWITGRTSQWWLVQKYAIEKWLHSVGVEGEAIFFNKTMNYDKLFSILGAGKIVIIGTKKIGGLPDGHIILAVGISVKNGNEYFVTVNDPAGNALTNYKNRNGEYVEYPLSYLQKFTGRNFYALVWEGKK